MRRFRRDCWGPTATEYAVLLVLIIFGALAAISLMGSFLDSSIRSTTEAIPDGTGNDGSDDSGSDQSKKPKKKPEKKKQPRRRRGKRNSAERRLKSSSTSGAQYTLGLSEQTHIRYS